MPHLLILSPLLLFLLFSGGCARYHHDPSAGAETVLLKNMEHDEQFEVIYLRTPGEGSITYEKNAWTFFWLLPVNHPDLGLWLRSATPPGTVAANVRSSQKTPWYGHLLFFGSLTLVRMEEMHFQMDPVRFQPIPPGDQEATD